LPTGEAVITSGGNLQARYVIHTVGPIKGRSGGRDAELLAACYKNSLALAVQHGLRSVAFPSISTGAFGYPREEAAAVSSEAIRDFLSVKGLLEEVRLVFYTRGDVNVFLRNHRIGEENSQAGTPPNPLDRSRFSKPGDYYRKTRPGQPGR